MRCLRRKFIRFGDIPVYLCTGKIVGYGSDGEPLLQNIKNYKTAK